MQIVWARICLVRQHKSATNTCGKTFVYTLQKNHSTILTASVFGTGDFHSLTVHSNKYLAHNPGFLFAYSLSCFLTSICFKLLGLNCRNVHMEKFQNHRTHKDNDMAVNSPSEKCNTTC